MRFFSFQSLRFSCKNVSPLYLQLEMFSNPLLILQITKTMGPLYENYNLIIQVVVFWAYMFALKKL
jgi:hypothetical protein